MKNNKVKYHDMTLTLLLKNNNLQQGVNYDNKKIKFFVIINIIKIFYFIIKSILKWMWIVKTSFFTWNKADAALKIKKKEKQ